MKIGSIYRFPLLVESFKSWLKFCIQIHGIERPGDELLDGCSNLV